MGREGGGNWLFSPVGIIVLLIILLYSMTNPAVFLVIVIIAIAWFCLRFTAAGGARPYRKDRDKSRQKTYINISDGDGGIKKMRKKKNRDANRSKG